MLTAEIYDMAPDVSSVSALTREGIDAWIVDFGAPEEEEGGLARTLDDHVTAVSDAVDRVRELTGQDVHLAGYSQGGMFAYQAAAFRRSEGLHSVITFGSPVDIHSTVPMLGDSVTEHLAGALRTVLGGPLDRVEGLPGALTSFAFKLLSARKEVQQFVDFVTKLHDRQELERREAKRLFLRGEGFVAWPGPAFRSFVDEFVIANRMATGGFVIDGRPVTLADIRVPILAVIGERDEMVAPPAARAIYRAAPEADVSEITVKAGHFGLVVGSEALKKTWPTVIEWVRWRDGNGGRPALLVKPAEHQLSDSDDLELIDEAAMDIELTVDVLSSLARAALDRASDMAKEVEQSIEHLRYQVPRLSRLRSIEGSTQISFAKTLAEQAAEIADRTFFLWNNVVRGLIACDISAHQRVGVLMQGRPSYLTVVAALNRIGAVAVLLDPGASEEVLKSAFDAAEVTALVADPENAARASKAFDDNVLILGGGAERRIELDGAIDMEGIDPAAVKLPSWYEPNPGKASDLAIIIAAKSSGRRARLLNVTNHRWAFAALGAAATATLTQSDTVYSCLPLHHAAGTMVSAGSALISGARLALAEEFSPQNFWSDVRRNGATVVFYAGEMCRSLVDAPMVRGEKQHPVRLFAGSGMRKDVWDKLVDRFGPVGVLEFYASTETNAVLANASGKKSGAVGHPMPGSREMRIGGYDFGANALERDDSGLCRECENLEVGLLLTRLDDADLRTTPSTRVLRDVFEGGDAWYNTGSLLHRDADGDFWFEDRVADLLYRDGRGMLSRPIEDAAYQISEVALAAAYEVAGQIRLALQPRDGAAIDADELNQCLASLEVFRRPDQVFIVDKMPVTDGFRPLKEALRAGSVEVQERYALDRERAAYRAA
jgi:putative long chain acyl-CoA synthase